MKALLERSAWNEVAAAGDNHLHSACLTPASHLSLRGQAADVSTGLMAGSLSHPQGPAQGLAHRIARSVGAGVSYCIIGSPPDTSPLGDRTGPSSPPRQLQEAEKEQGLGRPLDLPST